MKQNMTIRLMVLVIILLAGITGCGRVQKEFTVLEEAEKEMGRKINTPDMPGTFKISKVEYYDDGELSPIVKIYYENGNQEEIIFMIASSIMFGNQIYEEAIENTEINEFKWIRESENYVLKWRISDQELYKYLITRDEKDKDMLIKIAESYGV